MKKKIFITLSVAIIGLVLISPKAHAMFEDSENWNFFGDADFNKELFHCLLIIHTPFIVGNLVIDGFNINAISNGKRNTAAAVSGYIVGGLGILLGGFTLVGGIQEIESTHHNAYGAPLTALGLGSLALSVTNIALSIANHKQPKHSLSKIAFSPTTLTDRNGNAASGFVLSGRF